VLLKFGRKKAAPEIAALASSQMNRTKYILSHSFTKSSQAKGQFSVDLFDKMKRVQ